MFVAGLSFTHWHNIDNTVARSYTPTLENGELFIDLTQGRVITGPRNMKKQAPGKSVPTNGVVQEVQLAMAHLETEVQGPGAKKLLGEIKQLLEQYQHASGA